MLVTNFVTHNFDLTHFTGINNTPWTKFVAKAIISLEEWGIGREKKPTYSFFVRFLSEFYWNFAAFKDWYLFKSAEWMFLRRCWFVILTWLIFSVNSRVIIATFWRYRNVIIWNLKLFRHGRIKNWKKKKIHFRSERLKSVLFETFF